TRLDLERAVRDVLDAVESDVANTNTWAVQDMASHLLDQNRWTKYAEAKPAAEWTWSGEARADHDYAKARVPVPLEGRGCWVVKAETQDGRPSLGFVCVDDLAVVEKPFTAGRLIFVCDARTGR